MANGRYYPDIEVSTSPSVSQVQAIQTAQADLNRSQGTDLQTSAELVIYPVKEQFHLAWKLTLFSEQPVVDWFYMVDAHSGEILYKLNQLTDVTGDGNVYPTHPDLSAVTNEPLYRLSDNGRLQGVYASIVNDAASEAYSGSHSFQYGLTSTHFDEVNLYYHIVRFRQEFIANLDDGSLDFTRITAHAHTPIRDLNGDGILDPNAWFNRSTQALYFNDEHAPAGTRDFAKEDKVVYHEYSHAVIYDIESGIRSERSEEGAISEGAADYFAGAHSGRSIILDYAVPFAIRNMVNPEIGSYDEYQNIENSQGFVDAHQGGEFFSAILWDLRGCMSADQVDFLVYDALFRVTSDPSFLEFRDGMMAADAFTYGGSHRDLIQDTFADWWGLYSPPNVTIDGPGSIEIGDGAVWSADVSGGSAPYSYEWYKSYHMQEPVLISTTDICSVVGDENGDFALSLYVTYQGSEAGIGTKTVWVTGDGCIGSCS